MSSEILSRGWNTVGILSVCVCSWDTGRMLSVAQREMEKNDSYSEKQKYLFAILTRTNTKPSFLLISSNYTQPGTFPRVISVTLPVRSMYITLSSHPRRPPLLIRILVPSPDLHIPSNPLVVSDAVLVVDHALVGFQVPSKYHA